MKLYLHPLSSYCMKALIALYETGTPFEPAFVNLGDETGDDFRKLWPIGKFPMLEDKGHLIPESSILIEYLAQYYPGASKLIPDDFDTALKVRAADRFYDLHLHSHMQFLVGDRLRPKDKRDAYGVEAAWGKVATSLAMIDKDMAGRIWAVGDDFTMADCAAGPPLFYINIDRPLADKYPNAAAYLDRLTKRPSFARALKEAEPFLQYFPSEKASA
jgi:glutathione S-transferase